MAIGDDSSAADIEGHTKLIQRPRKTDFVDIDGRFKNLYMERVEGGENVHNHLANYSIHGSSENGKGLHIFFDRYDKVIGIVSDENEETNKPDGLPSTQIRSFGKRTVKSEVNRLKDLIKKTAPNKKYKTLINNSFTQRDTPYNSMREFFQSTDVNELTDKAKATWETLHGKDLTSYGETRFYDYVTDLTKAIVDKKSYTSKQLVLTEDMDVLDADDVLALIFA